MSGDEIVVIARMKAKEGKADEVRNALESLIEPTRSEPGCISYELHVEQGDERSFCFYEIWRSRADLDAHLEMPYLQEIKDRVPEYFEDGIDLTIWKQMHR